MLKIQKNSNRIYAAEVEKAVHDNGGYCPCHIAKIPDNKCICREFREQEEEGECQCGLYEKIEVEN